MSIKDDAGAPDGVLINSFNGADPITVKDECRRLGLLPARDDQAARWRVTGTYEYRDADGTILYRTVRKEKTGERKRFVAERPDGNGGWVQKLDDVKRVPYGLPGLLAANPEEIIFFAEGERKADRLTDMGFTATAIAFGCKGWRADYAQYFADRTVAILPDNDEEGRKFAAIVKAAVESVGGKACIVELPDLPAKGDIIDWRGTAEELTAIAGEALAATQASLEPTRGLPLEWCDAIAPTLTGLWLIKKLIPATGQALIYGHPGAGKSFVALDIAFHVALGWDWCGRKVKQGLVIYIGAEGHAGLRNRIVAFRQHYDLTGAIPLALVPTAIDLQAYDADTPRLIELIRDAARQCGHAPALIVVDTLSKTFGAGKENTDDMATYVANCGRIAAEFNCLVMPVHHRPKDAESTEPRGHGSLKGGVDAVILIEDGLTKKASVTKQKDGALGEKILFTLHPVHLGHDEDGEEVTSCVVQPASVDMSVPANPIAQARAKLSDRNKVVLAALGKALQHDGIAVPAEVPDTEINRMAVSKVVPVETWRARAVSGLRTTSDKGPSDPRTTPDKSPDTDRRTFDRAKLKLQSAGIIGIYEGFAWEL